MKIDEEAASWDLYLSLDSFFCDFRVGTSVWNLPFDISRLENLAGRINPEHRSEHSGNTKPSNIAPFSWEDHRTNIGNISVIFGSKIICLTNRFKSLGNYFHQFW